jgi:CheY-like chemotaxis protein
MSVVLVVDDDMDIRELMEQALRDHGHQVVSAANGQAALDVLTTGPRPNVLLLDLMMPVMSGWELRARMLQDPNMANIPTVVVTGDTKARSQASQLNATSYLVKPFALRDLLAAIDKSTAST